MGKQVVVGTLIIAVLISAVTWPIYEGGFWDYGGLGAMDEIEELEGMRGQPSDTLVYSEKGDDWEDWEDECLTFSESSDLGVWQTLDEDYDPEKMVCYTGSTLVKLGHLPTNTISDYRL